MKKEAETPRPLTAAELKQVDGGFVIKCPLPPVFPPKWPHPVCPPHRPPHRPGHLYPL
jgi:hypothetical protein